MDFFYFILKNNFLYTERQICLLGYIANSVFGAGNIEEYYNSVLSLELHIPENAIKYNKKWLSEMTPYDIPIVYNSMSFLQVFIEYKLNSRDYTVIVKILQERPI